MPCAQIRPELGVYLLGAVEPDRRAMVDRHLAACRSCRAELSSLAGLPSLLRRVPADVIGQLVADGTWAAVRYTARPWGTELEVSITGVAPGTRCQLLVTGARGQVISAGGWDFAASQPPSWYPASVPIQAAALRRFAITGHGKILVTIQARPPGPPKP